uniref:Uncharacterized protein n=1 Tax=Colobus angolensis palliatus TaxID=336983 RepID=A0A2K5HPL7_COLAP
METLESELCGELNATTRTGCSGKSRKTRCIWHMARSRAGGAEVLPVLNCAEGFLQGLAHSTPRWPGRTRSAAPLTGSSEPRVPLLPGMDWRRNLPLVCPAVCACAEVRPPLCLVRAMPLHVRVSVCVCL